MTIPHVAQGMLLENVILHSLKLGLCSPYVVLTDFQFCHMFVYCGLTTLSAHVT